MSIQPYPSAPRSASGGFGFIHFAGRVGDRNALAMPGAVALAAAMTDLCGCEPVRVGRPAPPIAAGWRTELDAALPVLRELRAVADASLAKGPVAIVLNRCAAALATLPAVSAARPDAAIVWFDAHADCNLPELTTSGYLGGLVISGAAGLWNSGLGAGVDLTNIVLVGARDLDPFEQKLVDEGRLTLVGPGPHLAHRLSGAVANRPVYVHLDCDVLEPGIVPSEYQVPSGLSLADLGQAMAVLAELELVGVKVAEFEAEWPDGTPGDPAPLIQTLTPLLRA